MITTLLFWYRTTAKEKKEIKEILSPLTEERYCDIRLVRILPKIKKEKETTFYLANNCLNFIFDHGTHIQPLLSDATLGTLYLDSKMHTLCLDIAPHPQNEKSEPHKSFILLEDVQSLTFAFYHPPKPFKKPVDPQEVGHITPVTGWQSTWHKDYNTLPAMIKVTLLRKRSLDPLEFVYTLDEGKSPIVYRQGL
jgi:hypothetical protein